DQQPRARDLDEPAVAQSTNTLGELHQTRRDGSLHASLATHNLDLILGLRKVEVDGYEALPRGGLQILHDVLIAGIVRHHELEIGIRFDELSGLLDGKHSSVVGQWVDDDDRVLARLDDLVEIADRSAARGERQRTILPDRLASADEKATREVVRGKIVMAGHGDER